MPTHSLPEFLAAKIGSPTSGEANPLATILVRLALDAADSEVPLPERLAASFDLVVASKFYQYVRPEGWLWCGHCELDWHGVSDA